MRPAATHAIDFYSYTDPETGIAVTRPAAASDEQKATAHAAALRRELQGIEHQLEHLDDPAPPWLDPPPREKVERNRVSLENTKTTILAELARLEPEPVGKGANRRGKTA